VDGVWLGSLSEVDHSGHQLIELGDREGVDDREPAAGRLTRLRVVAAIAVLLLFVLSGATAASANGARLLWTVQLSETGQVAASGGTVYVAPEGSAPMVTALERLTGRLRWRVSVPWTPQHFDDLGGGLDAIVVQTSTVDSADESRDTQTLFVQRSDGRVLAQAVGEPVGRVGRLVLQLGSAKRCPVDPSVECANVGAVDPATGVVAWSQTLPPGGRVLAGAQGSPGSFVTADADGTLTLRSAANGAVLAVVAGTLTGGGGIRLSTAVAGVLIVGVAGTQASTFTGYQAATLKRLWTVELPRDPGKLQVDPTVVDLARCGEAACVADGGGTAVLVPTTGAVEFRTPLHIVSQVSGGVFVALPLLGHLDAIGRYVSDVFALDPATGRVMTTVVDATLVGPVGGPNASTVVIRRSSVEGTQFATIGADGAGAVLLAVPGIDMACTHDLATLVCVDEAGVARAWSLQ
jgi:outer membrane protein assembly factor BamB